MQLNDTLDKGLLMRAFPTTKLLACGGGGWGGGIGWDVCQTCMSCVRDVCRKGVYNDKQGCACSGCACFTYNAVFPPDITKTTHTHPTPTYQLPFPFVPELLQ